VVNRGRILVDLGGSGTRVGRDLDGDTPKVTRTATTSLGELVSLITAVEPKPIEVWISVAGTVSRRGSVIQSYSLPWTAGELGLRVSEAISSRPEVSVVNDGQAHAAPLLDLTPSALPGIGLALGSGVAFACVNSKGTFSRRPDGGNFDINGMPCPGQDSYIVPYCVGPALGTAGWEKLMALDLSRAAGRYSRVLADCLVGLSYLFGARTIFLSGGRLDSGAVDLDIVGQRLASCGLWAAPPNLVTGSGSMSAIEGLRLLSNRPFG